MPAAPAERRGFGPTSPGRNRYGVKGSTPFRGAQEDEDRHGRDTVTRNTKRFIMWFAIYEAVFFALFFALRALGVS
ncbi:hypothetical protein SEA_SHAWTY_36 [Streptomyces phage Shawty]|uniref:Uncharacterized protein n=1 Tax=Streptomyces phage Shawty TaxID=2510521 RepID=A0A411CYJ4_9CAUD|nr:hypothetical protein SEA_SHAWTY_36 [Streptomyces phage Shawty]